MLSKSRIQAFAKKLLTLSLDEDGAVSAERALAVVRALADNPPAGGLSAIFKAYVNLVERQIAHTQLLVEHAGKVNADDLNALLAALRHRYDRPLTLVLRENKALLAGVRAQVGDDVYDASLAARLGALRAALN